jgi:deoxyadenosine/deoxycytidine kinase
MELESYRYIAIDGPIGAGKTSLAKRLASLWDAQVVMEQPEENPFLADFYRNAGQHAFQTQVFFLLQRMRQLQAPLDPALLEGRFVADFMLEKDMLFAGLTLAGEELARVRNPFYATAHLRVSSHRAPHDATVNAILKALNQP